jgi:putative ABC transport system permease protein
MHIDDAKNLLRIEGNEINEVAIRLRNPDELQAAQKIMVRKIGTLVNPNEATEFELHTWAALSPFASIAMIVDVLIITVKIVLISIVLVSVLNVMMMAVYERVREIGTIAAIGTLPSKIMGLFLAEGFILGLFSTLVGVLIGMGVLLIINISDFHFSFGRMTEIPLKVSIAPGELLVAALIVVGVALFSSFQPAYKASRLAPVDALRQGGE